jgi:hypothetical protein
MYSKHKDLRGDRIPVLGRLNPLYTKGPTAWQPGLVIPYFYLSWFCQILGQGESQQVLWHANAAWILHFAALRSE